MLLRWGPVDNINLPLCLLTRRSLLSSCPYINKPISQITASGIYFWKKAGQTRPAALRAFFMVGWYSGKGLMNTSNTSDTLTHSCSWIPVPLLPFRRYFPPIFLDHFALTSLVTSSRLRLSASILALAALVDIFTMSTPASPAIPPSSPSSTTTTILRIDHVMLSAF